MKIILDLFPILLFFAAYKYASIYEATAVLMGATVVQSLLMYRMEGKLATMQKASLALILVFGSLTLFFQDDRFIKFKPTLLYGCLALALWVSQYVFKRNLLLSMLGSQVKLPLPKWHSLNLAWIGYCIFMAAINAYVAAYYSTEQWVDFKIWGYIFPLTFIVGTGFFIAKYAIQSPEDADQKAVEKGSEGS
jgi:intracellular septation protein